MPSVAPFLLYPENAAFVAGAQSRPQRMTLEGVPITGEVIALDKDYDEGPVYWVEYRFQLDDRIYSSRKTVSSEAFNRAMPEEPIELIYLRAQRSTHI